jgi:alpha-L-fucosidase
MGEGPLIPNEAPGDWKGGSTAEAGPRISKPKLPPPGDADFRFTVANQSVYAFGYRWPSQQARLVSFASGSAKIERVNLLGSTAPLSFHQTYEALVVTLPVGETSSQLPYVLRLQGNMPLGLASS